MNGIELLADEDSLEEVVLAAAEGKTSKERIAGCLRDHSEPAE
jgi:prophage maintenance system killer protein